MINNRRKIVLLAGDFFLLYFSLFIALLIRYNGLPDYPLADSFFIYSTPLFFLWVFFLWILDFYSFKFRARTLDFFRFFIIFIIFCLFSGVFYFYLQPDLPVAPKTIFILQVTIFYLLFFEWRSLFDFLFKTRGKKEKILIIGSSPEQRDLLGKLNNSISNYEILGILPKEESPSKINQAIREKKIKKIVLGNDVESLKEISFYARIELESFSHFYEEALQKVSLSALNDTRYLEEFYIEDSRPYTIFKRVFDVFFSLVGAFVLILFYPFIALLIKINSRGPVFFTQERIDKKGKVFKSYKFRSMFSSPEREENSFWRERDNGEITKVGKFLRFTHLDELPQFLNILKGDMSLIGPRPEWKKLAEKYEEEIPFYFLRFRVKPGFTGWAQINFPASTSIKEACEKFQYDLYYVKNRSFLFDFVIFLKSLRKIFG